MAKEYFGWPWTDDGPIENQAGARKGRVRAGVQIQPREHKVRPGLGVPTAATLFEHGSQGLQYSLRAAVMQTLGAYEPGVLIPAGEDGVRLVEVPDPKSDDGTTNALEIRYINRDLPAPQFDELQVRLNRG